MAVQTPLSAYMRPSIKSQRYIYVNITEYFTRGPQNMVVKKQNFIAMEPQRVLSYTQSFTGLHFYYDKYNHISTINMFCGDEQTISLSYYLYDRYHAYDKPSDIIHTITRHVLGILEDCYQRLVYNIMDADISYIARGERNAVIHCCGSKSLLPSYSYGSNIATRISWKRLLFFRNPTDSHPKNTRPDCQFTHTESLFLDPPQN